MRLLVFQHIDCEHPGSLRSFLEKDKIQWDAINLHRHESIPNLHHYDALWVMGGPMDVWDVEQYPWLEKEKEAIRQWVSEHKKPFLGLCLGHQLLADALGGTCGPQRPAEIGVLDVNLTAQGIKDPLFKNMPSRQKFLQWHSVCVAQPPKDATILASSPACKIQALKIGSNVWSMQYHAEIEPDTVSHWGRVPEYKSAIMSALGTNGLQIMEDAAQKEMDKFLQSAENLYRNFMTAIESN